MSPDDFNERIELLVNDENRIVTYKVLSQELKIHVNKAKWCLTEYLNAQKAKGITLEVNYFLAGFSEMNGLRTVKVLVVTGEQLEKAKESFTELTSCHIYSIYRGVSKDECALYSADFTYAKEKEYNKYSAIKHPNIDIQPPVLNKMTPNNDVKSSSSKKVDLHANGSKPSAAFTKEAKAKLAENIVEEKSDSPEENHDTEPKGNKSSPDATKQKSGTLMSMWQKKEQSNGVKKESAKAEVKVKEVTKNIPKNNILSMFSKQAVKNAEKPPNAPKQVTKEDSPKSNKPEITKKEISPQKVQAGDSKKKSQKRKGTNKLSRSSKSKQDSDSESEFQRSKAKKHRRICTFDDSSESEPEEEKEKAQRSFFLSEEPMDTVEATPVSDDSEEPIPPTPPVIHVKGKAKVWKTVQKTFEDEDGFFVTKSEKELVSASEDEEDPLKGSTTKKIEAVEKKNPPVNKKQASLMSFFKQK